MVFIKCSKCEQHYHESREDEHKHTHYTFGPAHHTHYRDRTYETPVLAEQEDE